MGFMVLEETRMEAAMARRLLSPLSCRICKGLIAFEDQILVGTGGNINTSHVGGGRAVLGAGKGRTIVHRIVNILLKGVIGTNTSSGLKRVLRHHRRIKRAGAKRRRGGDGGHAVGGVRVDGDIAGELRGGVGRDRETGLLGGKHLFRQALVGLAHLHASVFALVLADQTPSAVVAAFAFATIAYVGTLFGIGGGGVASMVPAILVVGRFECGIDASGRVVVDPVDGPVAHDFGQRGRGAFDHFNARLGRVSHQRRGGTQDGPRRVSKHGHDVDEKGAKNGRDVLEKIARPRHDVDA